MPVLTKQQQVTEYLKCKNDFYYYCNTYVLIELPGGDVPFNLYLKQKEMIELVQKNKFVICLKTRQTGISTTLQAYSSWLVTFFDNVVVGVLSKDSTEATSFARSIRSMVEKLPEWMAPGFKKYTEQSFITKNSSKVVSATVNPIEPLRTLRGKTITLLIIDEAAFIQKLPEAWSSIAPALSTSQKHARKAGIPYGTVIVSTPNKTTGLGHFYFEQWTFANNSLDPNTISNTLFKPFIVYWKDIPELFNDPQWYHNTCSLFNFDQRKIDQELELKFLPTGGSFFDEITCSILQDNTKDLRPKQIFKLFNGEIWKYEDSIPGKFYLIGVDTASSYGNDMSAITIWDYETLEQVWEYQGKLEVIDFCKVVEYACGEYSNSSVVIERNSYGNQVMETLSRSPYSFLVYKEKRGKELIPGLYTDAKTRPLMIDALYSYITQFPKIVKSKRLALELLGLVTKTNGKVEGDEGCRDDLVLSSTFAFYIRKYDPPLMLEFQKTSENMFNNIVGLNYAKTFEECSSQEEVNAIAFKRVKEEMDGAKNNFYNILDFYRK